MVVKSLRKSVVLVILVITSSTLFAQPSPPQPDPTPTPDQPQPDTTEPGVAVDLDFDVALNASVEEMQTKSTELFATAQKQHEEVVKLQIVARKDKDGIRLSCINDALLEMRALLNYIQQALAEFDAAIAASLDDERKKHYKTVIVSADAVRIQYEKANQCAGELDPSTAGDTTYDGPDIPDDPGDDLFPEGVEDPGYASPVN
jgi:hypothetical protein